ncbi:MAG: efflux RND transporter periplasmic adaptor subunit [Planctomycetes bacterium]|nr:efflux RND transporter periplasmic adaptor subunit [Planctomycetota bacterium]
MNRVFLVGVAVVGGLGLAFVPWRGAAAAGGVPAIELYTVRAADLHVTLVETGTMVAKDSQRVRTKIRGESKIEFLIEEGKEVKEGDVVCKLDSAPLQKEIDEIKLQILETEANLNSARTEADIQKVETAAAVEKAKVALDKARKEAEKYRDGDAPQERRKFEVELKDAETKFNRAQKNLDDSQKLLDQNYIKKSELEDHKLAFEAAEVNKERAQAGLAMFDKYTFPMTQTDHAQKVADAEREVATAEKRGASTRGQKDVAVQQVTKRLQAQKDQLDEREKDLANMTLKAPCPGLVVHGDPQEWYRERFKVGSTVWGNQTILTIPDLRVMQVKLQIHEADIAKVKLGQKASITTDSYPGVVLAGEVKKIATVANSNGDYGGNSEVKKFGVEVVIATPDVQLRPGISAKVEIHVDVRPNALSVPLQCVFTEDGVAYCLRLGADGKPERHRVTTGLANDNFMEITDGLAAGDAVMLHNPLLDAGGGGGSAPKPEAKDVKEPAAPSPGAPVEASGRKGS